MRLPNQLVLLRHGESEGNVANRLSRAGDNSRFTPRFRVSSSSLWRLTENGRSQAKKAGVWMNKEGLRDFDVNVHSDMNRAIETANLTAPEDSFHETYLVRERSWGLMETMTHEEKLNSPWGAEFASRDDNPFHWLPPGESYVHTLARVRTFLDLLASFAPHHDSVRVVCHGEIMWTFRVLLEHIDELEFKRLHLSKSPAHKLYNCHLLHYRKSAAVQAYQELRSVCTYNPNRYDSGWMKL